MTVTYGFYDSLSGDRKYNASQMSRIFEGIITDGIFSSIGTGLAVTATGTNMNVTVGIGRAWFNYTWTLNDAPLSLTVSAAPVGLSRIDTVILEVNTDLAVRANSIKILTGTPGSSPVAPTLSNTATLKQYALAYIAVGSAVTTISNANITNLVGTASAPWITGPLTTVNAEVIYAQFEAEFDAWFADLQNELDANQAANLQSQINDLEAAQNGWLPMGGTMTRVSEDGSTGVANIGANVTGVLNPGMRLKYEQSQALTAYWDFNANSNSQVGSFNGTDTAVTYTAGKFGNAATFNGTTSKIVLPDNASLKPTGDFTIGLWFKSTTSGATQGLFQTYASTLGVGGLSLRILNTTNALRLIIGDGTGFVQGVDFWQYDCPTVVTDGAWHYVVVTHRGTYFQVYLDGKVELAEFSLPMGYNATSYIRVGCQNNGGTDANFLTGQIDDLFLINGYALDEQTIREKYNAQSAQGTGTLTLTKYGIVTNVAPYSGGVTPVTFWGGNDFNQVNAAISNPYYSSVKAPYGFNINPAKWSVIVTDWIDKAKTSPAAGTWYGQTNTMDSSILLPKIVVPIGLWKLSISDAISVNGTATAVNIYSTLSTSQTAETDKDLTASASNGGASGNMYSLVTGYKQKFVNLSSKATYYMLVKTTVASLASLNVYGTSIAPTILLAESLYL